MEDRILQLELSIEHAQRDIDELRDIVISLSWTINSIDEKITKFIDEQK